MSLFPCSRCQASTNTVSSLSNYHAARREGREPMCHACVFATIDDLTSERDRLAKMYEAATLVLALHLNDNCTTVAKVRARATSQTA